MGQKTAFVEYVESGTYQGGEEDAFIAGIARGSDAVVMSMKAFKSLRRELRIIANETDLRQVLPSPTFAAGIAKQILERYPVPK